MKLYRGIKSQDFSMFTPEDSKRLKSTWKAILQSREAGDFSYPEDLNLEILDAADLVRLQRQHFSDNREIARTYAKENGGMLIEIDVPLSEILKNFTIEFQKFAQRKKNFEIVYVIDAEKLFPMAKKWKLKTQSFND